MENKNQTNLMTTAPLMFLILFLRDIAILFVGMCLVIYGTWALFGNIPQTSEDALQYIIMGFTDEGILVVFGVVIVLFYGFVAWILNIFWGRKATVELKYKIIIHIVLALLNFGICELMGFLMICFYNFLVTR